MRRTGVRVTRGMTGPYGRLNHFGHPERDVRRYYVDWFKGFADIVGDLGAASIGTQFAIFTYRDYDDPARREALISAAHRLLGRGRRARARRRAQIPVLGADVGRPRVRRDHRVVPGAAAALDRAASPCRCEMMADIDHGDLYQRQPRDYDPYAWARAVPRYSPIIHIKQSLMDKGGHRPFTAEHNAKGRIQPKTATCRFARRRRREQRDLPGAIVQGARSRRPPRHRRHRRIHRFLDAAYRRRRGEFTRMRGNPRARRGVYSARQEYSDVACLFRSATFRLEARCRRRGAHRRHHGSRPDRDDAQPALVRPSGETLVHAAELGVRADWTVLYA